jgi:dolichol-phosphate mannosyltransferase
VQLGILIPTYDEAMSIKTLLREINKETSNLKNVNIHIVIVDDSSLDGTGSIVKKVASELNSNSFNIELLTRKEKNGFGTACVAGFKLLLKNRVNYVLQMDADLSHDPVYLPSFVKAASNGYDLVIGSRYTLGGGTPDWSWYRRFLSKYGNMYAKNLLGKAITDYTGGYNLYSKKLLEAIDVNSLRASGYGFLIELKFRALRQSTKFCEIPIVFRDRTHGRSKIPKSTLIKNIVLVPKLKFQSTYWKNKL